MRRASRIAIAALALLLATGASAAPAANLHEIKWFVHVDLIDGGAGMDLAFYESMLDEALADARLLVEGHQGPVDTVCCSRFEKEEHSPGVTLTTFGTTGDGLDVIDTGETATIAGIGGSGSRGFIVDSINDCAGAPAIGCASLPGCGGGPDDDPTYHLIVTLDAADSGVLGLVIAHERGHNACLEHVASDPCELMRSSVAGGCLSASECSSFTDARQTTGDSCACHADVGAGDPEPIENAIACSDGGGSGVCSGGVCDSASGDAGVELLAAGGPESPSGATTDDALRLSGLPGGWTDIGDLGSSLRGLAFDPDAEVLYGIADGGLSDDTLVIVDPDTGTISSTVGTITGYDDLTSLAFDPGATSGSSDDRLLALTTDGSFEDLIEIDPSDGSPTFIEGLATSPSGSNAFEGLAYDSLNDKLYTAGFTFDGLWEIDLASCGNPGFCAVTEIAGIDITRIDPSLAYSRDSGRLYQVGGQTSSQILYDTIDATTFETSSRIGLDGFTPGGLAALPAPEPTTSLMLAAGSLLLAGLARRRRGAELKRR
jgi:hypothetical protein